MRLEGWHIVIIIVLAIVLFGAPKLPGLARSVGQSLRIFKSEIKQLKDENPTAETDSYDGGPTTPQQSYATNHQGSAQRPAPQGHTYDQHPAGQSQQNGASHTTL